MAPKHWQIVHFVLIVPIIIRPSSFGKVFGWYYNQSYGLALLCDTDYIRQVTKVVTGLGWSS